MEKNNLLFGIEIKATKKPGKDDIRGLLYWKKYQPASNLILIRGGNIEKSGNEPANFLSCTEVSDI